MPMFLVVLRRSGPMWDRSRPMEEQSGWEEHAAFMDGLVDAGFLVLGGPLADEVRTVHAIEAESEEAVRATLARDPWHRTHVENDAGVVVCDLEPGLVAVRRAGEDDRDQFPEHHGVAGQVAFPALDEHRQ